MTSYREDEGRTLLEYLYLHPEVEVAVDTEGTGLDVADETDHCIGVSIAFVHDGQGFGHYFGVQHETGENVSRETIEMLNWVLTQQQRSLVFANAIYDILSLRTIGIDIDTSTIFDIIAMAHLINENEPFNKGLDSLALMYLDEKGKIEDPYVDAEKVSGNHNITPEEMYEYAVMDAVTTWRVKQVLAEHPEWTRLPEDIWESKQQLIKVLIAMKRRGVRIDTELAAEMEAIGTQKMAELKAELGMNPASGKDMQKLMLENLGLPVLKMSKPSKRFPDGQPSFTKDVMEEYDLMLERLDQPQAKLIKQYRGWQKAVTAAYRPYLALTRPDGRIRCSYKLHGTVTGRFSCSEPNLQQIPKASDKPWNGRVKECFVAQEGYTLVELDYSQLELRLGTAYANEESLKQVFEEGRDIFTEMSLELGFDRQTTKTFVYSTQYGAGVNRIMAAFGVDEATAKRMLNQYHRTYPRFKATSDRFKSKAEREKFITLWSGRRRHFKYKSEGYKAMNSAIQGGAADIVERVMVRVFNELDDEETCRLLLQVHDSLTFEIRNDLVDDYVPKIKALMEDVDGIVPERLGEGFGVRFAVEAKVWSAK